MDREKTEGIMDAIKFAEERISEILQKRVSVDFTISEHPYKHKLEYNVFAAKLKLQICNYYKINVLDFEGERRTPELVRARQMFSRLSKDLFANVSLKRIGMQMGGRDHATVLNSLGQFQNYFETELAYRAEYKDIRNMTESLYEEVTNG